MAPTDCSLMEKVYPFPEMHNSSRVCCPNGTVPKFDTRSSNLFHAKSAKLAKALQQKRQARTETAELLLALSAFFA